MAVALVLVGVIGLVWFGWLVWPPAAVLIVSLAALAAGLLVDWEKLRGKPARPGPRSN